MNLGRALLLEVNPLTSGGAAVQRSTYRVRNVYNIVHATWGRNRCCSCCRTLSKSRWFELAGSRVRGIIEQLTFRREVRAPLIRPLKLAPPVVSSLSTLLYASCGRRRLGLVDFRFMPARKQVSFGKKI